MGAWTDQDWELIKHGPPGAARTVLLLAGGNVSARFYGDFFATESLSGMRLIGATIPGMCGSTPPDDWSVEHLARITAELASAVGADLLGGHSFGANVALETAAAGLFDGPLLLLSPSLSKADEFTALAVLDALARFLGPLPYAVGKRGMASELKKLVPPERRDELIGDVLRNDAGANRAAVRAYFQYLDRHGSLATRLCAGRAPTTVVYGSDSDVGLTDEERQVLDDCARVEVVGIEGAGHMTFMQQPAQVAQVLLARLGASAG